MICGTSGRDGNQMTDPMKCQGKGVGAVWTAGPVQFIPGREVRCGESEEGAAQTGAAVLFGA